MGLIVTLSDTNTATGSLFWDEGDTIGKVILSWDEADMRWLM